MPSVELFFQYGLSDSFELGMTTNFSGLIGDVKYQFFDGEVLDMAQTSYFTGKDFKGRNVLLRSIGLGFGFGFQ